MRKIRLALVALAFTVAAPTVAATFVGGPFKSYGDCRSRLAWFANSQRWGEAEGWGHFARYAGYDLYCLKRDEDWFIAYD